jgi:hypothetical protein
MMMQSAHPSGEFTIPIPKEVLDELRLKSSLVPTPTLICCRCSTDMCNGDGEAYCPACGLEVELG